MQLVLARLLLVSRSCPRAVISYASPTKHEELTVVPRCGPIVSALSLINSSTPFSPPLSLSLSRCSAIRMASPAFFKLEICISNFSSFAFASPAHVESDLYLLRIASNLSRAVAEEGAATGVGRHLTSFESRYFSNASFAVSTSSGVRCSFCSSVCLMRYDSLARMMIYRQPWIR